MTSASTGTKVRQWLMTGVSYMIPFVAAGGILIALGFLLGAIGFGTDGIYAYDAEKMGVSADGFNLLSVGNWAFLIFWLGKVAFMFFVPALAAYIAFAIADRPGLVPGFVAGALATGTGDAAPLATGTGFLGAILGGFLAGFIALWISRWPVPNWIKPIMPVVAIPLFASLITGIVMVLVLKAPISALVTGLTGWLGSLSGVALALLGLVLGLMMAFDMGGPVNKVAYTFAVTGLATAGAAATATEFQIMAIVMAAGMTPPLGLALATNLRKSVFTESELENGKAAWLLGASFISEGAIPFAAADPLRVIPSIMVGSGVTGALVALFGNELRAPHGGIFVFPLVSSWLTYVLAIAIGTVVTALLVMVAKGIGAKKA
ncbi:MAG: PTS fructose transporter subunit IIC [Actinomycetota bacterium]